MRASPGLRRNRGERRGATPEPDRSVAPVSELWLRYKHDGSADTRDQLLLHYLPLVAFAAERVGAGAPSHVDRADLASYGVFGLLDAIEKFDADRGIRFETYAISRIRGSILDELRSIDWVPRRLRARIRAVGRAQSELENRLLRSPTDGEVGAELGMSVAEIQRVRALIAVSRVRALVHSGDETDDSASLAANIDEAVRDSVDRYALVDSRLSLAAALSTLTSREQDVLASYYFDHLPLAEIAERLGVTESRVCQIHRKALLVLRQRVLAAERELAGTS